MLTLRQAIVQRVHGKNEADLTDVIESSIGSDERALPGLGVLFEMIWGDCSGATRQQLVHTLHQHLNSMEPPLQTS